ncbi:MAG: MBL fold metallo-hydrolase [Flavobacteriaceae bacterium]
MTTDISRRTLMAGAAGGAAIAATGISPASAKAPMQGDARPVYRRVKLGDFEVTTIYDGHIALDGPHPIFGMDQSADAVQALAKENFLPPEKMTISFAPIVVNTGSELVLFDSGNGAARRPNAGLTRERLSAAGFAPEMIDVVVLTHYHGDHIGGLMEDGKPAYPNARYFASAAENNFWTADAAMSGPTEGNAKLVQSNVVPLAEKTTFLDDGGSVVGGITAVAANGHTPGHTAYHLESGGKRMLLWGDSCNHFVASMQRPDWHVRFDMDKEQAVAARKKVLGMVAADRILANGYHMPFPAMGYVEQDGDGFRWVPLSYQFDV